MNIDLFFKNLYTEFPFYKWLIPVNMDDEYRKFLSDKTYNPQYKYPADKEKLDEVKKNLGRLEIPDDPYAVFYRKLKTEHLDKIGMIEALDDPAKFTALSKKVYGDYTEEDTSIAKEVLETYPDEKYVETVSPEEIKKELEAETVNSGITGWNFVLKKDIAAKVTVSPQEDTVYIKSDLKFFPDEAKRLRVHEIRVHLFRSANGARQPLGIFRNGLAGYLEAEEGLAVYFENQAGVCPPQEMKIYAGRLKAVEFASSMSFRDTYIRLLEWFPPAMAYRLAWRAKRGLTDTSLPGGITKDIHYITGYRKVKNIIQTEAAYTQLFVGKVALDDISVIGELLSSGRLINPAYLPS
ncbi:MAG: DUF1704 domain-containing protein [Elusimicrobia bacterium]|nr:DUF1704 domain-containing protein [Elusimicrobiota bacterium]